MDSNPMLEAKVKIKPNQRINNESGFASGSGGKGTLHKSRQPLRTRRPKRATHQNADMPKI